MPKELGDLVNLTDLYLNDNKFQGEFVCSSIHVFVRFADIPPFCFFVGELPKELGNLVKLTKLYLSGNAFQGKLYVPAYMRRVLC